MEKVQEEKEAHKRAMDLIFGPPLLCESLLPSCTVDQNLTTLAAIVSSKQSKVLLFRNVSLCCSLELLHLRLTIWS